MAKKNNVALGDAHLRKGFRIYAIGDIHGCLKELNELVNLIEKDLKKRPVKQYRLIFIGDYVDRGPDTRGVVQFLMKLQKRKVPATFLRGNHEEKLVAAGRRLNSLTLPGFVRYGGLETLASYGLSPDEFYTILGSDPRTRHFRKLGNRIKECVGKPHRRFFKRLKSHETHGDYFFCHAGVDPQRKLHRQRAFDLVWMREPFLSWGTPLSKVVVHGHTPREEPELLPHRINIDTGCVYGGKLTALVLEGRKQRLLQVTSSYDYRNGGLK